MGSSAKRKATELAQEVFSSSAAATRLVSYRTEDCWAGNTTIRTRHQAEEKKRIDRVADGIISSSRASQGTTTGKRPVELRVGVTP